MRSWPSPITHSPTSEATGSIPPPTKADSSTPSNTSACSTSSDAGCITNSPRTTTLAVTVTVVSTSGSNTQDSSAGMVNPSGNAWSPDTITGVRSIVPEPEVVVTGSVTVVGPPTVVGPESAVHAAGARPGQRWEMSISTDPRMSNDVRWGHVVIPAVACVNPGRGLDTSTSGFSILCGPGRFSWRRASRHLTACPP